MTTFKSLITVLFAVALAGCANATAESALRTANKNLRANFSPLTYVKTSDTDKVTIYESMPAGEVAASMAPIGSILGSDVLSTIQRGCGFSLSDLKEIRVVEHDEQKGFGFEVWIFNDPLSERDDNITAITVLMQATPDIGGTDLNIQPPKDCHSPKPMKFYFGK